MQPRPIGHITPSPARPPCAIGRRRSRSRSRCVGLEERADEFGRLMRKEIQKYLDKHFGRAWRRSATIFAYLKKAGPLERLMSAGAADASGRTGSLLYSPAVLQDIRNLGRGPNACPNGSDRGATSFGRDAQAALCARSWREACWRPRTPSTPFISA